MWTDKCCCCCVFLTHLQKTHTPLYFSRALCTLHQPTLLCEWTKSNGRAAQSPPYVLTHTHTQMQFFPPRHWSGISLGPFGKWRELKVLQKNLNTLTAAFFTSLTPPHPCTCFKLLPPRHHQLHHHHHHHHSLLSELLGGRAQAFQTLYSAGRAMEKNSLSTFLPVMWDWEQPRLCHCVLSCFDWGWWG